MIEEELPASEAAIMTGAGFGERDAFAALSLDDGATWKNVNLSDSALRSSFMLRDGHAYPGDVFKMMHAVEGNKIVVAYVSRFCESGAPLYSWDDEEKDGFLASLSGARSSGVRGRWNEEDYQLYTGRHVHCGRLARSVDYTAAGLP